VSDNTQEGQGPSPRAATRRRWDLLVTELPSGSTNVNDLADRFGVSASTIRRDLAVLASSGRLVRTYGGALRSAHGREVSLNAKKRTHWPEKDIIGKIAAAMVKRGDILLLDAGTTVGRLAWHLRQCDGTTVVTNGMSALLELADTPGIDVILLGGRGADVAAASEEGAPARPASAPRGPQRVPSAAPAPAPAPAPEEGPGDIVSDDDLPF